MKIKSALLAALLVGLSTIVSAQRATRTTTPDVVVRNLYAAHRAGRSPFFQTKSRALVDRYFTSNVAESIWKDAVTSNGEVGALGFDPLYNAQDVRIVAFKIGRPMYGEGNFDVADVPVTFKNMGKAETILFRLERDARRVWKVSNIYYPSNQAPSSSLVDILSGASNEAGDGIRSVDFLNHSYQTSVCSEQVGLPKTVTVRGGKFTDRESNFFEVVKNETAYGEVDGDGSEDAVVLVRCGAGAGTLRAFEVHAYSFREGRAKLLARLDSDALERDYRRSYPRGVVFYAGEVGPKIVNRHVLVEALTDGSFAGPANIATFDYQLRGGRFVLSGKPTRKRKTY